MKPKVLITMLAVGGASLALLLNATAAELKSPQLVKEALRILAYVQADMASKLPTKSYARLPHENQEFQEAAVPMRVAVDSEPAAFKARVDALLKTAQQRASDVAEVSKSNDEVRIRAAVAAVDAALKPLNELFPVALRPVPGQLGGRPGGPGGGPPPDLR